MVLALTLLSAILTTLCLAILLWTSQKLRRTYSLTLKLRDIAEASRRHSSGLFAQIQALLALERKLNLSQALPPVRGWAGSPDFLLHVADEVLESHPLCVLECSSGVSTVVVARCLQINGKGHAYSLEHDPQYAAKTRQNLTRYGLHEWATIIDAPLEARPGETPWYAETAIPTLPPVELLIIDGPPKSTALLARYPALPRLGTHLASGCIVLVDDADRPDEKEMVRRWLAEWPQLSSESLEAEKGLQRLRISDLMTRSVHPNCP